MRRVFSFFLLHAILLCCVSLTVTLSAANILGNETDRLALLAFKSQLSNNPLSSWNDSHHFCEWKGVQCSRRHPRVIVLNIQSNSLKGIISPHIGRLSFLRMLILRNNSFGGEIPQQLGQLFRLRQLDLTLNNLVGKIPMELGSLSKLVRLSLGQNKLSGIIPSSLGNLTSLQTFYLSENDFVSGSFLSTLVQLKSLKQIGLGSIKLSGKLPSSLFNISTLEIISIEDNELNGHIPSDFGLNLPNLQLLYLGNNRFSGPIPVSLFNASKLQNIDISNNQFTGEVPPEVGNLKDLQILGMHANNLGRRIVGDLDFFNSLTNCSNLQVLTIMSNQFGGTLPASIGNFSNQISRLYMSQNYISGNIPTEIKNLKNLILLDLSTNFLTGNIPMGIENLQNLGILYLYDNHLSGHLPSSMNMSRLFDLDLSYNILEGSIASSLDNTILQFLDLSYNNFTGTIPNQKIGQSSRLINLTLAHNSLSGSIPSEVGNLEILGHIDVSDNKMSGEIPSTLGNCLSLEYILFQGNSFQGQLPPSLSSLKGLTVMDVSHNNISGEIPKELEKLTGLKSLNLSFNNLEGEVPIAGIFGSASAFSVLGNYNICGGIPKLGLDKCHSQKSKRQGIPLALKVTLGVLIPLFMVAVLLVIYLRKKPKAEFLSKESLGDLKRVSYNDLHKATDGFSSAYLIGTGSHGTVYKGFLRQDEDPIAVKVLNLMENGASKSFVAECEALKVIRHRNLLKILTVCSSVDFHGKDFKALVFEFMRNGSLESWLHPNSDQNHLPRSLNLYERLNIAIDIASALDYIHNHSERTLVHCDLKSSNVLLGDDMTAHVGDFGLAKFLFKTSDTSNQSESIALRGTIGYIPPEYNMHLEVTTKGDMYSYGILLLEILTGKRPTDHIFKDGLSLHTYSKMALPHQLIDIIDVNLLSEETHSEDGNLDNGMKECLISLIKIGVDCSVDQSFKRMDIKDVLKELHSTKEKFFRV